MGQRAGNQDLMHWGLCLVVTIALALDLNSVCTLVQVDTPPDLPLLLLATADVPVTELEPSVQELFHGEGGSQDWTARLPRPADWATPHLHWLLSESCAPAPAACSCSTQLPGAAPVSCLPQKVAAPVSSPSAQKGPAPVS